MKRLARLGRVTLYARRVPLWRWERVWEALPLLQQRWPEELGPPPTALLQSLGILLPTEKARPVRVRYVRVVAGYLEARVVPR